MSGYRTDDISGAFRSERTFNRRVRPWLNESVVIVFVTGVRDVTVVDTSSYISSIVYVPV